MIKELKKNEYFVFGSNEDGLHYGGAAEQAHKSFKAEMGVGEGLTGKCYAFPTLDNYLMKRDLKALRMSRNKFYKTAKENPEKIFLMTAVGTGIAGFSHGVMKNLFKHPPANVVLPEEWC